MNIYEKLELIRKEVDIKGKNIATPDAPPYDFMTSYEFVNILTQLMEYVSENDDSLPKEFNIKTSINYDKLMWLLEEKVHLKILKVDTLSTTPIFDNMFNVQLCD